MRLWRMPEIAERFGEFDRDFGRSGRASHFDVSNQARRGAAHDPAQKDESDRDDSFASKNAANLGAAYL
ncbi:MAG: hypothetical protein AAEJ52_15675, partial [Myxococcota bacterium]